MGAILRFLGGLGLGLTLVSAAAHGSDHGSRGSARPSAPAKNFIQDVTSEISARNALHTELKAKAKKMGLNWTGDLDLKVSGWLKRLETGEWNDAVAQDAISALRDRGLDFPEVVDLIQNLESLKFDSKKSTAFKEQVKKAADSSDFHKIDWGKADIADIDLINGELRALKATKDPKQISALVTTILKKGKDAGVDMLSLETAMSSPSVTIDSAQKKAIRQAVAVQTLPASLKNVDLTKISKLAEDGEVTPPRWDLPMRRLKDDERAAVSHLASKGYFSGIRKSLVSKVVDVAAAEEPPQEAAQEPAKQEVAQTEPASKTETETKTEPATEAPKPVYGPQLPTEHQAAQVTTGGSPGPLGVLLAMATARLAAGAHQPEKQEVPQEPIQTPQAQADGQGHGETLPENKSRPVAPEIPPLTEAELSLLFDTIPTMALWDQGMGEEYMTRLRNALANPDPYESAEMIAVFVSTLNPQQRKDLVTRVAKDIKDPALMASPRHKWLADRLLYGAWLMSDRKDPHFAKCSASWVGGQWLPADQASGEKYNTFKDGFLSRREKINEKNAKFHEWIAQFRAADPSKPETQGPALNAIRKLQNEFNRNSAMYWIAAQLKDRDPDQSKWTQSQLAAGYFLEALTRDENGNRKDSVVIESVVNSSTGPKLEKRVINFDPDGADPFTPILAAVEDARKKREQFRYLPRTKPAPPAESKAVNPETVAETSKSKPLDVKTTEVIDLPKMPAKLSWDSKDTMTQALKNIDCSTCHGSSYEKQYDPKLTLEQFFGVTKRGMPNEDMREEMKNALSPEQIKALKAYYDANK